MSGKNQMIENMYFRRAFYKSLIFQVFYSLILACLIILINACVQPKTEFESIPEGPWRGVLLLNRQPVVKYGDDRDIKKNFDFDSELPFTFIIGRTPGDSLYMEIQNGEEKIRIYDVKCGKATISARDTFRADFIEYDTYLSAVYEDGIMEGHWVVPYKDNYKIPFKAVYGQNHRFVHDATAAEFSLNGKWRAIFESGPDDAFPAVGEFSQKGNSIMGTFLTETGDYRYLHGNIIKNKLYLSAFDGAHAFLITAKFLSNDSLTGTFRSGTHYTAQWTGIRSFDVSLQDPFDITRSVNDTPLKFKFPDENGQLISLDDERFKNKIKLIQIMGTWCPNCMDEIILLREITNSMHTKDIAWISLAYERYKDKNKALAQLKKFKEKLKLKHDLLWAGHYKKEEASATLPHLSGISSYPTLLFLDKNNMIRYIHTGFSGPATKAYNDTKEEFKKRIETLAHEVQ